MSKNSNVAEAVLGQLPTALTETVSLATPLTISRIEGRNEAVTVLRELADSFGIGKPEFVATDDQRAYVTFVGRGQGRKVGLFGVLTRGSDDTYSAVDLYARPWPFVKLVHDHLAATDTRFQNDTDLSVPYEPAGPPGGFLTETIGLPGLAADVAFHSPVLTDTAAGRELVGAVLMAVEQISGAPRFRVATRFGNVSVLLYDATVHGHTWQLALVIGLDGNDEIADMSVYSRPWPVAALFRGEIFKMLRDRLGPEYWQGEDPLIALAEV